MTAAIAAIETSTDPRAVALAEALLAAMHPGGRVVVDRSRFIEGVITVRVSGVGRI